MEDFIIDSTKVAGKIWNKDKGWLFPKFPDVPAKTLALYVHSEVSGWFSGQIEDKLIELGFQPSYRYLGLNNPRDKQDPTSLVFFIRKYRRNDPELDTAILALIQGGIPARAVGVITHKIYCAVVQLPMDRNDSRDDD